MSSQRQSSQRYGSGTVSGSLGRGASGPGGPGSFSKGYGSGLVSLGTTKKPRTASSLPERKLSVPRPVNLPSLRKENAGNDPNTQLVPSGGGGGWQKPEQKEESSQELAPNLTAGSSWASAPSSSGVPSWQPPQPFPVASAAAPRGRSLNPHEYPSLSAAASAKQPTATKQPVPHLPSGSQGGGNWDEDERKPSLAPQARPTGESWADSLFEDDERPAYRPPWETNGRPEWRSPNTSDGSHARSHQGEEHWNSRGQPTPRPGFSPKPASGFREVEDPTLFPPPPPPRHGLPPPPPPPRTNAEPSREETEAEKRAFEAEIDRVIEEEKRRRREHSEAARAVPAEIDSPEERVKIDKVLVRPPPPPPPPQTAEQRAAAAEVAKQKSLALRKQREAEAEEVERLRREAAAAKLRELEERIAQKEALARELAEKEAAAQAPVETPGQEAAVLPGGKPGEEMVHSASKNSLTGGQPSSIEAEAGSSVGEAVADLEGAAPPGVAAATGPPGIQTETKQPQPKALWQRKDREAPQEAAAGSALPALRTEPPAPPPPRPQAKEDTGAPSLFGSSSGFGPGLVATSMGASPRDAAAQRRNAGQQGPRAQGHAAPVATVPPGPMSWREVLGGSRQDELDLDDAPRSSEELQPRSGDNLTKAGRGASRRDREHAGKEDRQAAGRGDRGRGRHERGRGRGRAKQDAKDDASVASTGAGSLTESGPSTPQEGRKASQRQRAEGRGKGLRGEAFSEGRARGHRGAPQAAPLGGELAPKDSPQNSLPPGIPRPMEVVLPPVEARRHAPAATQPGSASLGWGAPGLGPDTLQMAQLGLGAPDSRLSPALDPIAPLPGRPDARADRAIDRPKSAAGVVGRPRSSAQEGLLPNGMPVLPNDLSLDAPAETKRAAQAPAAISFGFNPGQTPSGLAPGPFPGVFFPQQRSENPWQAPGPGGQHQPNLEAAMESFYKAGAPPLGGGGSGGGPPFGQQPASQAPSSGLQFGAFGAHTFPQFGQLGSSFGQAPFVPTGKQPDWSTGPISSTPSSGGLRPPDTVASSPAGGSFGRAPGLDAIVPSANIQKRGMQGAPGPPGLQRSMPGPQLFQGAPGLQQLQPPPGLQHHGGPPPSQLGGMQRSPGPPGHLEQSSQALQAALGPSQAAGQLHGPPPGIGNPSHHGSLPSGRDQAAVLPEDVFEKDDVKLAEAGSGNPPAANGQMRRGGDGGRRGGRLGPGRGQGRSRNYGRGPQQQNTRGPLASNLGGSAMFQGGPPGVLPSHGFGVGQGDPNYSGSLGVAGLANDEGAHHADHGASGASKKEPRGGGRSKSRARGDRGRGRDFKFGFGPHSHTQAGHPATG